MEFDLGSNKYLTVSDFKDVTYVHVRQFEQGKNGKIPTKVGVHFTPQTFDSFIVAIRDIDEARLEMLKNPKDSTKMTHISGQIFATVKKYSVDLRWYYKSKDGIKPTKRGVWLSVSAWLKLKDVAIKLKNDVQVLRDAKRCLFTHESLRVALQCKECLPDFANDLLRDEIKVELEKLTQEEANLMIDEQPPAKRLCVTPPSITDTTEIPRSKLSIKPPKLIIKPTLQRQNAMENDKFKIACDCLSPNCVKNDVATDDDVFYGREFYNSSLPSYGL